VDVVQAGPYEPVRRAEQRLVGPDVNWVVVWFRCDRALGPPSPRKISPRALRSTGGAHRGIVPRAGG